MSRGLGSSVSMVSKLRTGQQGFVFSSTVSQTDSEAHPPSYPMGTGGLFVGGKVAEARSWPLTFD